MKNVTIVSDGASRSNGRSTARAAAAAVLEFNSKRKITGEYLGNATNQQAEIIGAALGLEALKEPCEVTLISDSQYVIKTMKGLFKRKTNHEFWQRLDNAARGHKVKWEWTRGHAGHPVQEICDKAATTIADAGIVDQSKLDSILEEN